MRLALLAFLVGILALPAHALAGDAAATPHDEPEPEPDFSALSEYLSDGMPDLLAPESFSSKYKLPANVTPPDKQKLPTKIEYADGPLKWDIGTNVTTRSETASIVPVPKDPYVAGGAAGATGEVKGQLRYKADALELYGTQTIGSHQGDGTAPTFNEMTTIGSLYRLPGWMAGGTLGASLELNTHDHRKSRIEYRQPLGGAEGYVAAEQTFTPDRAEPPVPTLRAGVNRKF